MSRDTDVNRRRAIRRALTLHWRVALEQFAKSYTEPEHISDALLEREIALFDALHSKTPRKRSLPAPALKQMIHSYGSTGP